VESFAKQEQTRLLAERQANDEADARRIQNEERLIVLKEQERLAAEEQRLRADGVQRVTAQEEDFRRRLLWRREIEARRDDLEAERHAVCLTPTPPSPTQSLPSPSSRLCPSRCDTTVTLWTLSCTGVIFVITPASDFFGIFLLFLLFMLFHRILSFCHSLLGALFDALLVHASGTQHAGSCPAGSVRCLRYPGQRSGFHRPVRSSGGSSPYHRSRHYPGSRPSRLADGATRPRRHCAREEESASREGGVEWRSRASSDTIGNAAQCVFRWFLGNLPREMGMGACVQESR